MFLVIVLFYQLIAKRTLYNNRAFNLFADDGGEPVILENDIHSVS